MHLSDLQFDLPPELIAQEPAEPRDSARLWIQRTGEGEGIQTRVAALADYLDPRDLLVFNNTRVLPARLWGQRASGGRVELLFLEPAGSPGQWLAMVRPAKKPKPAEILWINETVQVRMVERVPDRNGEVGAYWRVQLEDLSAPSRGVEPILEQYGEMPLPPYIQRPAGGATRDREHYQTMFAEVPGAVAAPTAGLHFTPAVLDSIQRKAIATTHITLHVGLGTFLPIQVEDLDAHVMHEERFHVSEETVQAVQACKARGGRVIAVGTTSARALEAASRGGSLKAGEGRTDLFIRPGYSFSVVDGLFTNFHLPGSTLLLLVSALLGRERLLDLYEQAIGKRWRFFSYGDAMLVLP
ncbi:MAG: tRNA preQ1(34) S-adenosylmethionine ribosyltransferase-isomerase QueA [Planctomycetes bacterium]|nr:tRNA preQ1(34) S-adenosylmethionine ribosyltransferase-isomerase QueA [Planctomycetota bacterium]